MHVPYREATSYRAKGRDGMGAAGHRLRPGQLPPYSDDAILLPTAGDGAERAEVDIPAGERDDGVAAGLVESVGRGSE
jgi:hypothetical protein